ncbi:anti-sigma factor [Stenotrophomonas sp. TWI819]|uniref:anti-sigma factor n=1 Tax=Stenotrophomonas sp. TWI819 TaxID=3136800 RepID=UPI003207AC93
MTPHDSDHDELPAHDELSARLRALPTERVPPARVWQGIAARLPGQAPAPEGAARTPAARWPHRHRWPLRVGLGMAAALAVLMVVPTPIPQTPAPSLLQRQADAMAGEYQQAIAALPSADVTDEWRPALHELDASADTIRAAIAENPRSRYLLGQLQRTYALRLELTQQAVLSAGLPT